MNGLNFLEQHTWFPFAAMGLTHQFFGINTETILYTWATLGCVLLVALLGRVSLTYPNSIPCYIAEQCAQAFRSLVYQSVDAHVYRYYAFIGALFIFICLCNTLVLIPGLEEPTKDINTTLALALISFFYTQKEGIRVHGLGGYIKEYFRPIPFLFPLEILSKLATIISLAFRLFGNIFGGAIIGSLWKHAISGSILWQLGGIPVNLVIALFFGLFEGFIQAFVFSILSLTYLGMAVRHEEEEPAV